MLKCNRMTCDWNDKQGNCTNTAPEIEQVTETEWSKMIEYPVFECRTMDEED